MKKYKFIFLIIFAIFLILPIEVSAWQINVNTSNMESIIVEVESSDTIEAVKQKIYEIDNRYSISNQKLIFGKYTLEDGRSLSDYNIGLGDSIELELIYKVVLNANGGKFNTLDQYVIDNWDYTMYDNLVIPTREGYKFIGYFTETTTGTKLEMILNESGIDRNMTFYAQWEEIIEENPNTLDNIGTSLFVAILSIAVFVCIIIYLNKKNKIKV